MRLFLTPEIGNFFYKSFVETARDVEFRRENYAFYAAFPIGKAAILNGDPFLSAVPYDDRTQHVLHFPPERARVHRGEPAHARGNAEQKFRAAQSAGAAVVDEPRGRNAAFRSQNAVFFLYSVQVRRGKHQAAVAAVRNHHVGAPAEHERFLVVKRNEFLPRRRRGEIRRLSPDADRRQRRERHAAGARFKNALPLTLCMAHISPFHILHYFRKIHKNLYQQIF